MTRATIIACATFAACEPAAEDRPAPGSFVPSAYAPARPDGGWLVAEPDYPWSFPRDHGPHFGYNTEWWYFTGLVAAQEPGGDARELGYQFTVFKVGVTPNPSEGNDGQAPRRQGASGWDASALLMGHLAVTDPASQQHVFSEVLYRASPLLAGFGEGGRGGTGGEAIASPDATVIAWALGPSGTSAPWRLAFADSAFAFSASDEDAQIGISLVARPARPVLYQGPNGYSRKSAAPGRASMYYSHTRMATTGTVRLREREYEVSGTSWMDHEFSSDPLAPEQAGWDWVSLRLDDGRDVMAFQLRRADGEADFAAATITNGLDPPRHLSPNEWSMTPASHWTSPETGARYPVEWAITLPGESVPLALRARFPSQENVSSRVRNLHYWEGIVDLFGPSGLRAGTGYLEMTGYGAGSRPAL